MIANVKATKGVGNNVLEKTIHKGSESIMFSVLQETQYMYPFKSSVREIVSNSLDSISERDNARKIFKGDIEVKDLFIEKEGEEFKDSKFNEDYYDLKWLSSNPEVTIRYTENATTTRDKIEFIDEGVGLGGDRLVNYFSLGFSTKRLSKSQLGSFGLGAKSLLATGVDFYTVTSRYNGKEFKFNVYKDHVVSVVPKFNDDGTKNKVEKFYNGFECHYKETQQLNGVIVEAEVKRHRKQDYFNAIENQLGFIDNIKFVISDPLYNIKNSERHFKSEVLYKTDKILVGDTDYYARPQILLKPGENSNIYINYGPINFDELEMKRYSGNVSFIMNINDVDVTPSRESVIWNSKTREAIKKMFIEAQNTILDVLQEQIKEAASLPEHLNMLESFKGKNKSSSMSELYKVIDVGALDLKYRTFNLAKAAETFDETKYFSMTSTNKVNSWSSSSVKDTDYTSKMSKEYFSYLHSRNNNFSNTFVYIGGTRYKDLARYLNKKVKSDNSYENINIVFIKDDFFNSFIVRNKDLKFENEESLTIDEDILKTFLDKAYAEENHENIVLGEIILAINNGLNLILEKDIDKSEMKKVAEEAEKMVENRYLSTAERAKLENKVSVYEHNAHYKYKAYKNESDLEAFLEAGKEVIIYKDRHPTSTAINNTYKYNNSSALDNKMILGLSEDAFKRFSKVKGVKVLTDCLYTIEFGDIKITPLGKYFLPDYVLGAIKKGERIPEPFNFLNDVFTNKKIIIKEFDNEIKDFTFMLKRKRDRHKEQEKAAALKEATKMNI